MNNFTSVEDVGDPAPLVDEAIQFKQNPYQPAIGRGKAIGLIFFNPSLRTRLSTQKAAMNLGMDTIVLNIEKDGWKIEFADGAVMDGGTQEHIKDAVAVISQYVDIIGVRTFPSLANRGEDYNERVLGQFLAHAQVPVVSLESATLHPLQSLADLVTIKESGIARPKVAVTWAPHPKALPQSVANSFLEWIAATPAEVTLAHPAGYGLAQKYTQGVTVTHRQEEALEGADFVYAKSWSSYEHYGQCPEVEGQWTVTEEKMALTRQGRFMHCLPIRRNVVATDGVVDASIVLRQAKNRECAAQAVLNRLI